eukprot:GHVU01191566.1.p1 GENE.GHVU01191566.1~~GHVU01191566.1.p1  ORF type:complete len:320 (+),score=59.57 GHVU01191566.1:690-1649(+)
MWSPAIRSWGRGRKVALETHDQSIETSPQPCDFHGTVLWNELFTFAMDKASREGNIQFVASVFDEYSRNVTKLGEFSIPIDILHDQKKHKWTKKLSDDGGEVVVWCQWVHSRQLMYQQRIRELTAAREVKMGDVQEEEELYEALNRVFAEAGEGSPVSSTADAINSVVARLIGVLFDSLKMHNLQLASVYLAAATLFFALVSGLSRPMLLDISLAAFILWCSTDLFRWGRAKYTAVLWGLFLSLGMDVAWLCAYFNGRATAGGASLQTLSKIFSLINFLWKTIVTMMQWKRRYDFDKRTQVGTSKMLEEWIPLSPSAIA